MDFGLGYTSLTVWKSFKIQVEPTILMPLCEAFFSKIGGCLTGLQEAWLSDSTETLVSSNVYTATSGEDSKVSSWIYVNILDTKS